MEVTSFAEISDEFFTRVNRVVWCNVATIDRQGRPRSRILHPTWEAGTSGPLGWIGTRRATLKAQHLLIQPYVSLAYVAEIAKPVYVDCRAVWVDDPAAKQRIWDRFKTAPAPMGYDPGTMFKDLDDFGLLHLIPWRIEVRSLPGDQWIWHAPVAE